MSNTGYHLAQFNIAIMWAPLDDPSMADFVSQLEPVNRLADSTPGFVWRLQSDGGDATSIQAYEDPRVLINMTVWESIEALFEFTYRNSHGDVFRDRKSWFEPQDGPSVVLWWIPAGHIPTVEEGKQKLDLLKEKGPGPNAFTFKKRYSLQEWLELNQIKVN